MEADFASGGPGCSGLGAGEETSRGNNKFEKENNPCLSYP